MTFIATIQQVPVGSGEAAAAYNNSYAVVPNMSQLPKLVMTTNRDYSQCLPKTNIYYSH